MRCKTRIDGEVWEVWEVWGGWGERSVWGGLGNIVSVGRMGRNMVYKLLRVFFVLIPNA
ncbi:MAG: hypothetical protein F6K44_16710 [Moorea sp. SIO3E2]|nr:hypothetical protein [Moorena sp. SIO3E2]